jgi:hypothetical protein
MIVVKMKKLLRMLSAGLIVLAPFLVAPSAYAASASVFLSPSSGSVTNGNNLVVNVFEDSGAEPVNAASLRISYPTSLLQYVSISNSSAFNIVATSSGGGGAVSIDRGANPAVTGNQLIASITFKAVANGTASVTFPGGNSDAKVLSQNTNQSITTSAAGGSYSITTPVSPPPPAPSPSPSPTPSPSPSPSPSSSSSKNNTNGGTKATPPSSPSVSGKDTSAPAISGVVVSDVGVNTATITWTTSEPATTQLNYGLSQNYNLTAGDNNFVTAHKIVLNTDLLSPGVEYHFAVKSVDPSGNAAASEDQTFTTKGATVIVTVIDQNKKPVPQAKVTFNKSTGVTDKDGHATLTNLQIGKLVGVVNYKGKQTVASIEVKPIDPNGAPQAVTLTIKKSSNYLVFIIVPLLLLAVLLAVVMKSRGGDGDNEIKDLRGLISGNGKDSGTKKTDNTPASTPASAPSSSSTPTTGPTVVRPTIPPRS